MDPFWHVAYLLAILALIGWVCELRDERRDLWRHTEHLQNELDVLWARYQAGKGGK